MSNFMNLIGIECSSVRHEESHLNPSEESCCACQGGKTWTQNGRQSDGFSDVSHKLRMKRLYGGPSFPHSLTGQMPPVRAWPGCSWPCGDGL